jgi:hypothetical protein
MRTRRGALVLSLYVLTLMVALAFQGRVEAALTTSHLPDEASALSIVNANGGAVRVTAETRIGGKSDWELGLRRDPLVLNDGTQATADFDAWLNGIPIPFFLAYDGTKRVTMTLVLATVANRSSFSMVKDFNEIFIPTRAVGANTSIVVGNLFLNGAPIAGSSSAINKGTDAQDVLRIQGAPLSRAFLLAGTITMHWSGAKPTGSRLDSQFWLAKVVAGSPDTAAPTITVTAPPAGSLLPTATPIITATFADAGSGIDPASARLTLDGVDRTAEAQASAAGLTFTPSSALAEGAHMAQLSVRDREGNQGQAVVDFTTDAVAPAIIITSPSGTVVGNSRLAIVLDYSDSTSGVDLSTLRITLDGASLAACNVGDSSTVCQPPNLALGAHTLTVNLRDRAGNAGAASLQFNLVDSAPPTIVLTAPGEGAFVNTASVLVTGSVSDEGQVASVTVNGAEASLLNGEFHASVALVDGFNEIHVVALDMAGNQGQATRIVTLDRTPPQLFVKTPLPGQIVNSHEIHLSGQASDDYELAEVGAQGQAIPVSMNLFDVTVPVASGDNLISVRALDRAGNETVVNVPVNRFDLPEVTITSPADLSFLAATTVDVNGMVSDSAVRVTVNGVPANVSGTTFRAAGVPLLEGGNILTVTATDANGHVATASINVVRDLTPPHLSVQYPLDGSVVVDPMVFVSGMVNDIVAGTVNAAQATVTVNGWRATVANRSFVAQGIPLTPGENVLSILATDASGNVSETRVTIRLATPGGPRIYVTSGNLQEGTIGTALSQPLVATLVDATGLTVANKTVLFKVQGNDGTLDGGKRQIALTTDGSGRASGHFTLGMRAGVGNQVVVASSTGFQGPAVFLATAHPGPATFLVVDSGDQQVGVTGRTLPRPLMAVVTDRGYNRLEGTGVNFNVAKGQGRFQNGLQKFLALSDTDGRLIVPFTLDPEEGIANNIVEGKIDGLDTSPMVSFVSSSRAASDPAATSISGAVLDNASQPIAGVTLRILDTALAVQTDEKGLFRISGAPVGTVKLIVDGSTVERSGSWPDLEFALTTIPGRDNTVNMPIYLLPLNLHNGITVDETHGGTLTLPEVPGFALEIAPGSVTFPGGSRSGFVSVTVVHNDKVPMVPSFGQQPRLIVTIQPAGARFDPPARLTLPNVEGLAPGEVTEMYSFDHDLGHFVSIGPATVSEDGSLITSNPGVGVLKAGWHCGGNPSASGTPNACPLCNVCNGSQCVPGCDLQQFAPSLNSSRFEVTVKSKPGCNCGNGLVCSNGGCVCPVPVNFRQTNASQAAGGVLHFEYHWDSSTGDLMDLSYANCQFGEQVVYPNGMGTFVWPKPWSGSTSSPAVSFIPASTGFVYDDHSTMPIQAPYMSASFTAQQRYIYTCPCANGGQPVVLQGIHSIVRTISQNPNGTYKYEITKTGSSAGINPLP